MCPRCVTAVLLMVGGATSTASVTAFGAKERQGSGPFIPSTREGMNEPAEGELTCACVY